eukprot:GFUD01058298.1.p1 GENE.GFUD01058298.1~~GFUD01058298.1.p1  ORF type:complete len:179 (+),score=52.10 GFUD01058298.1:82-618(+)
MGGPCFKVSPAPSLDGSNKSSRQKKVLGPACTDNFQIKQFSHQGQDWCSVEQCYQALKFKGDTREIIQKTVPRAGETGSSYGMRVWRLGQIGREMVLDWEETKVEVMFFANLAKYQCNPELQKELVEETGELELVGGPSTWEWSKWNGLIQMKIRSLVKEGKDLGSVEKISMNELENI